MSLTAAGLVATAISFAMFITLALWYVVPWMVWLFVAESLVDLSNATTSGIRERALETAFAVTWLILDLYVALLWVTLALIIWRLVTRQRGLEPSRGTQRQQDQG